MDLGGRSDPGQDADRACHRHRAPGPTYSHHAPKGLEHVGPRAFGYDLDFRSVFAQEPAR